MLPLIRKLTSRPFAMIWNFCIITVEIFSFDFVQNAILHRGRIYCKKVPETPSIFFIFARWVLQLLFYCIHIKKCADDVSNMVYTGRNYFFKVLNWQGNILRGDFPWIIDVSRWQENAERRLGQVFHWQISAPSNKDNGHLLLADAYTYPLRGLIHSCNRKKYFEVGYSWIFILN